MRLVEGVDGELVVGFAEGSALDCEGENVDSAIDIVVDSTAVVVVVVVVVVGMADVVVVAVVTNDVVSAVAVVGEAGEAEDTSVQVVVAGAVVDTVGP